MNRDLTCDEVFDHLSDLLDGTAEPGIEAAALDHLATCERCEITLAETRAVIDLAAGSGGDATGLDDVTRGAMRGRLLGTLRYGDVDGPTG